MADRDYIEELLSSAIPLMHVDTISKSRVTMVAILFSVIEAQSAVLEIQHQELKTDQIAIIGKDYYQATEQLSKSMANDLTEVLTKLGIDGHTAWRFVKTINKENFLIVVVSKASEANQIRHVLAGIGTVFRLIGVYQYLHN